jgi:urease accessory protein
MAMPLTAAALLLADARLPSGAHAHSGGLEPALEDGLDPQAIPSFLRGRLTTVARTDSALAAGALRLARAGELDQLDRLDLEAVARTPSPPLRAASRALGQGLLRTAARMWPGDETLAAYRARSTLTPRPVALGVAGAAAGLRPLEVALVSLHGDLADVAFAAVRLLATDAAQAAAWLSDLGPEIERVARAAAGLSSLDELPSLGAPLIELRSLAHHQRQGRLFAT